jgi:hypothetical protein
MFAFSSAYPVDKGIDFALVLLVAVCVVAALSVLEWLRN